MGKESSFSAFSISHFILRRLLWPTSFLISSLPFQAFKEKLILAFWLQEVFNVGVMWNVTLTKHPLGRSKHLAPQVWLFALSAAESRWAPICKREVCFHGGGFCALRSWRDCEGSSLKETIHFLNFIQAAEPMSLDILPLAKSNPLPGQGHWTNF